MNDAVHIVSVPKWGMEMTEGEIVEWHVAEGDTVKAGDPIVEIETAKIVNSLAAHHAGIVRRILVNVGSILKVGSPIAVIAAANISEEDIDHALGAAANGVAPEQPSAVEHEVIETAREVPYQRSGERARATVIASRLATRLGIELDGIIPSGRNERINKSDVERAASARGLNPTAVIPQRQASAAPRDDSMVKASPVARRLAASLGINLHDCRATGRGGRVSKADVETLNLRMTRASGTTQENIVQSASAALADTSVTEEPLSGMRKSIARRLQTSKQQSPHFRVQTTVCVDELMALRQSLNTEGSCRVSLNDCIIKATACSLRTHPELNCQFDGDLLRRSASADIAIAVATDGGLLTPIIRGAHSLSLREIAARAQDLAEQARLGQLTPHDYQGGTFSISNLGMYGIDCFDAIINPPHVAILAVGAAQRQFLPGDNDEPVLRNVLRLTLSCDHRVIDGALAAQFMASLKGFIETPAMMLA